MRIQAYVYLGWSPLLAVAIDGERRVLQVVGWEGGSGTAPATGLYVGASGYVSDITDGVDIRGNSGAGVDIQVGTNIVSEGAVVFSNSNGVTFGMSGSTITASVDIAGGGGAAISAGTNIQSTGTIIFSNSNGVTFGLGTDGGMTASVNTNYQSQGAYLTTAMLSNANTGFLSITQSSLFQLTSGMSDYQSTGNYLTTAQPVGAYLTTAMLSNGGSNFVGLNTAITGNGVSATINSSGISLNVPQFLTTAQPVGAYLTTAMQSNKGSDFIGTNTALTANGVSVTANSSGLSLNFPAFLTTAQPVGAYLTTARASNDAIGLNTALTGNGVLWTVNSSGLSLNVPAFLTTAQPVGAYLTTAAQSNQVVNLVNGSTGQISFAAGSSLSSSTNGSTITWGLASNITTALQSTGNYLTTAMVSNAGSNFVGLNSALTGNGISATINSSGISLNVPQFLTTAQPVGAYLTTAMLSNAGSNFIAATASFSGINATGTIASNGITVSVAAPGVAAENNWINLLGANTTGNTTASGSTIGYSGINLTLSGTNNSIINISAPAVSSLSATGLVSLSVNGSTISIGVPETVMSRQFFVPFGQFSSSQQTNSQMSMRYFSIDQPVSFSRLDIPMNVSIASTTTANTANIVFTSGAAIYSLSGSTLNPIVGNTGNTTYTWASNTANYSSIIGGRYASFPLATQLSAGEYWLGVFLSTNNNSSIGTATTQLANTISVFCGSILTAQNFAEFGATTGVSSVGIIPLQGMVSISISNTTMTFQQSQITQSGTAAVRGNVWFNLRNI